MPPVAQADVLLTHDFRSGKQLLDWCAPLLPAVSLRRNAGVVCDRRRELTCQCNGCNRMLAQNERLSARTDAQWLENRPEASKKSGDVQYKKASVAHAALQPCLRHHRVTTPHLSCCPLIFAPAGSPKGETIRLLPRLGIVEVAGEPVEKLQGWRRCRWQGASFLGPNAPTGLHQCVRLSMPRCLTAAAVVTGRLHKFLYASPNV